MFFAISPSEVMVWFGAAGWVCSAEAGEAAYYDIDNKRSGGGSSGDVLLGY